MKVKYFAWVRERVGKAEETVEPPADIRTIDDLIGWLARRGDTYAYAFEAPQAIRARLRSAAAGGGPVRSSPSTRVRYTTAAPCCTWRTRRESRSRPSCPSAGSPT